MGEDVKLEVIRTTQDYLSKYIKKPPLTDKLLRKPPFRYLHDITTAVMRETGFLQGLFSQDELNPENIKDREAKIAFLEKLIAAVNLSTGINITARPNKIVAGLDVAKTNELLQTIGKALDKKIDSSKAVEQVLNKNSKNVKQRDSTKKDVTKIKIGKDVKSVEGKHHESRNNNTLKKKTKDKAKDVEKPESKKTKLKKEVVSTKPTKAQSIEEPVVELVKDAVQVQPDMLMDIPPTASSENLTESLSDENRHNIEPKNDVTTPVSSLKINVDPLLRPDFPKQDKEQGNLKEDNIEVSDFKQNSSEEVKVVKSNSAKDDQTNFEEELKRPQSARAIHRKKAALRKPSTEEEITPKIEDNKGESSDLEKQTQNSEELHDKKQVSSFPGSSENVAVGPKENKRPRTAARPASARPGAPRVRDRGIVSITDNDNKVISEPVNLIVDSKDLPVDDNETLVTVEASASVINADQMLDETYQTTEDQGHLVSQILETQEELEDVINETSSETTPKVDVSWSSGRQREHETVIREVEKLQTAIQALTRAANPLGKLIDFLHEDIDSMQTELETWLASNQQLEKQLHEEERLTEESIDPLARQLEDINLLVEEQLEEMSVVKAVIIRNDERLARLLKTNTAQFPE